MGCGHGVAVSLASERLTDGRIVGIDRSAKMIEMATRRNRAVVASGTAAFQAAPFEQAALPAGEFDKIFAFHVAAFWRTPALLLDRTRRLLAPGGALYLFNQLPGWGQARTASSFGEGLRNVLAAHDFDIGGTVVEAVQGATVIAVVSLPSPGPREPSRMS